MVVIIAALVAVLAILGWVIAGPVGAILAWVVGCALVLIFAVARAAWG